MPKRRKTPAAQGDPPAAIRAVAQKRPKTVPIQEINYQKLAEEIIKQQRATQSSANATLPVPPAPNDGNNDTVWAQPIHQTIAQLSTAPVQETALSPNALGNATQTPSTTSLGPSTSTARNSSTDVTVSSLVSQIFGTHEGGIQFHASIKSPTDANTSDFFGNLSQQACHLLSAALTNNTKTSYKRSWDLLLQFNPTVTSLPISPSVTSNFIAHLFTIGYSPSSISSHISAISYVHKILGLSDPSESFLVRKIVQGCHHSAPNKDTRLPITGPILHNLVNGLHKSVQNLHYRILLKAIFLLAFNAFLRLGELVVKSKASSNTVIQREDVSFEFSNKSKSPSALVLLLRNFKTNKTKDLFQIHLKALGDSDMCPVLALYLYLEAFSHQSGPLFQFMGGDPVSYAFVSRHLHNTVLFIGLNPALYKGHSFRIGAATQAAQQGFSENCIQKMGRWNSDAVRRYIRLQSFVI